MTTNPSSSIENMNSKLDLVAIEQYSQQYADKLCDGFFNNNETIGGQQLLGLSNVQQVNLLVISRLFSQWQTETAKLKSPYFDFDNEEVKQALQNFMNTVSQHISIQRVNYQPLLQDAVINTLVLTLNPHHYFDELLRDQPDFVLKNEVLAKLDKYTRLNQFITHGLVERMGDQEQVYVTQAISWLNEICVNEDLFEDNEPILAQFSEIVPITKDELLKKTPQASNTAGMSFFDMALGDSNVPTNTPPVATPNPKVVVPVEVPVTKPYVSPVIAASVGEVVAPVVEEVKEEGYEIRVSTPPPATINKEIVGGTFNDSFTNEKPTFNESLKQTEQPLTLAEKSAKGKIESISKAIALNQQFVFINNLFHGDQEAYNSAISELDQCQTLEAAKELMNRKYAPKYLWRMSAENADALYDIVRRRFAV
jgi:hypothetical protein